MSIKGYRGCDHRSPIIVLGDMFGPKLVTVEASLEDALSEFDELFGERVDWEADKTTLEDYDGDTVEDQVESAMNCGDIRVNSGGTTVWVDHYEWMKDFQTKEECRKYFQELKK